MSRSQGKRAVFTGKLRGNVVQGTSVRENLRGILSSSHTVRFGHTVRCVQATSAKQLSAAQQFWIHRYREAGLGSDNVDPPGFNQLVGQLHLPFDADPVARVTHWRTITFLAYRMGTRTIKTDRKASTGDASRFTVHQEPIEQLCGTVTLLSPFDRGLGRSCPSCSIGRITRLAVDHSPFGTGVTPTGYRTVFLELTSLMHSSALSLGLTHLDAIVHPRHAKLYRRVFGAVPIGEPFACEDVGGSPGQYMRADITHPNHFHARLRGSYERREARREKSA